jgi:predicted metal-dependent HD superfamily phosphohydrolase
MPAQSVQDMFEARWRRLTTGLGVDAAAARPVLDELLAAYGDPARHYHDVRHITELLHLLDRHGRAIADLDAVELAVFFHDAFYVPTRSDNEAASAALARDRLSRLGVASGRIERVEQLVLATRHLEQAVDGSDSDLAQLVDVDLAILASPRETYADYARAIRAEYSVFPDDRYRPGRRRVLQAFLARKRIYLTPHLHDQWEEAARANLAWEIDTLA